MGDSISTIDAAPPVGICGSGVLDILAEMYSSGIVDKGGESWKGTLGFAIRTVTGNSS